MNYIVIEIQKSNSVATLVDSYDNRNDAYSKYYSVLSYAAKSQLPLHSAAILTEEGQVIEHKFFAHSQEDSDS